MRLQWSSKWLVAKRDFSVLAPSMMCWHVWLCFWNKTSYASVPHNHLISSDLHNLLSSGS